MGHLLLLFYSLLAPVIAVLYALFFLLSPRRSLMKALAGELKERLALAPPFFTERPVWLHAASMGEVKAVARLAPELAALFKAPLLMTSSTAAGRAEAVRLGAEARLAPLDFYPLAASFMAAARPRLLALVETEIWPATLYAAAVAGVPVYMVNARISGSTAALYRALAPLSRLAFAGVKKVLAQSELDAALFRGLPGLEGKVEVTGNLKHDLLGISTAGTDKVKEFFAAAGWRDAPVFTAGSTHPQEEPVLVEAWLEARKAVPGLKLVLAPRHPERLAETEALLEARGVKYSLWSEGAAAADCLVVDTLGLLQALYSESAVCFVGGTLDATGGHNLLEPALFGKPALFGPNYRNARHAGDTLIKLKGGFLTETAPQLAAKLSELLTDPAALQAARDNSSKTLAALKGATARTLAEITTA
ncbi:MAG: glycosyltransferase N-terminal domain-containing protein [Elusimicrobiales bacterium]|nr:glycosyltransferase N-terminal domain-containing protein [Elusimicrobiales bacterium]